MDLFNAIYIMLALLFVKHWYVDFVIQTPQEVAEKGTYGKWHGIKHSMKHGIGTVMMLMICSMGLYVSILLGVIDAVVHYHIDWAKMNYGNRDITTPEFWNHLGLDQLAHYITYLIIVGSIF